MFCGAAGGSVIRVQSAATDITGNNKPITVSNIVISAERYSSASSYARKDLDELKSKPDQRCRGVTRLMIYPSGE